MVTALPLLPNPIAQELNDVAKEVHVVGDAANPALIVDAIAAGAKVGHEL